MTPRRGGPPHAKSPVPESGAGLSCAVSTRLCGKPGAQSFFAPICLRTVSATSRIVRRRSIEVFWIQREGLGFAQAHRGLEEALGAFDELAGLEALGEVGDLRFERADLRVAQSAISSAGMRSAEVKGLTT